MTSFSDYANDPRFQVNLGLSRITELMKLLGNPQDKIKTIHVAGTNGKGSVCAFLREMLTYEGFKTGLFSSPELVDIHERITIDGVNIPEGRLTAIFSQIEQKTSLMAEKPSPFEVWTAAAYLYFYEEKCDFAVIETGMGGLTDATNVIKSPILCIITRISIDHTDYLGKTIEEISFFKGGIIKDNRPVITLYPKNPILGEISHKKNAPLIYVSPLLTSPVQCHEVYNGTKISLPGLHQAENAALAKRAAEYLGLTEKAIKYGLSHAKHKARFEFLSDNIIFDGAHNENGAKALSENLYRYFGNEKFTFIYAAMRDKEIQKVLSALSPHAREFIFTSVPGNARAASESELSDAAKSLDIPFSYVENPKNALNKAKSQKLIITGSLYLYKHIV